MAAFSQIGVEAVVKGLQGYVNDLGKMEGANTKVGQSGSAFGKIMGKAGLAVAGAGIAVAGAAIGGIAALGKGLSDCVREAMEAEEATAALQAVLKSTGGRAGVTADEANALASSLQNVTRYSDEEIMAAETMLLQFETMNASTFPVATQLALDLATRLGTDAAGAAQMLGKALAEPGEGLLRLKQAGVTFTDQEEEQIKAMYEAGNVAGAQAAIMDKLQASLGGAAQAAGETFAGRMDILKNQMSDMKETIGAAVLPALSTLAGKFQEVLADPKVQETIRNIAEWLAVNLPIAIEATVRWIKEELIPAVQEMVRWVREEAVPTITEWWGKLMDFKDDVVSGWNNIIGAVKNAWAGVTGTADKIVGWFASVYEGAKKAVEWFQKMLDKLGALADAIIPDWLQGKSPPPMANWLNDIAGASANVSVGVTHVGSAVKALPAMAPAGAAGGGGGGPGTYIGGDTINQYITDPVSMAMAQAMVADAKRTRWNAAMGVT